MKKLFAIVIIAVVGALAFSSCSKSSSNPTGVYSFVCNYTQAGVATTNDTVFVSPSEPKNTASTQCNAAVSSYTSLGFTGVSCTLH